MTESIHKAHAQDFTLPNRQLAIKMTSMQHKFREMSSRIQQLEDALQSSRVQHSPNEHLLLEEDLLRVKEANVLAKTCSIDNETTGLARL